MDSPKTKEIGAKSPPLQESPFTSYVSTLSPINQSGLLRARQSFREIDLKSPPPVFMSPKEASREAKDLPRSQDAGASVAGFFLKFNDKSEVTVSDSHISQSSTALVVETICSQTSNNNSSSRVQSCSPPGVVDEYLTEPSEECLDSAASPDISLKKTIEIPQALEVGSNNENNIIVTSASGGNGIKDANSDADSTLNLLEEALEDDNKEVAIDFKESNAETVDMKTGGSEEKDEKRISGEWPRLSSEIGSGSNAAETSVGSGSSDQVGKPHLVDQASTHIEFDISEGGEIASVGKWHDDSQLLPESFEPLVVNHVNNEYGERSSKEAAYNHIPSDTEESNQLQRGTRRRCLQFAAAESLRNSIGSNNNLWDSAHSASNAGSSASIDSEITIAPSRAASNLFSNENQMAILSHNPSSRLPFCQDRTVETYMLDAHNPVHSRLNSPVTSPVSLGIGLHLNSIVKAVPVGSNIEGEEPPGMGCHLPSSNSLMQSNAVGNFSAKRSSNANSSFPSLACENPEMDRQTFQAPAVANLSNNVHTSPHELQPLNRTQSLSQIGSSMFSYDKQTLAGEDNCSLEEFNQTSPRKKRKRASYTTESGGCKRCNCKKSKCLKLYCECFAAGSYCADPCTCQDCFNKPEHGDRVLEIRQQIESRNPLAFVPRVVPRFTESPQHSGDDGSRNTPASARHKRGCNCKKSLCLKKYCECYQAGVGCSEGCRCEGCKNVFGKKEGCSGIMGLEHRKTEDARQGKVPQMLESRQGLLQPEGSGDILHIEQQRSDLSPPTSLVRCASHGKGAHTIPHLSRRHLTSPSPESESSVSSFGKSPVSPRCSSMDTRYLRMREGYPNQADCHTGPKVDPFSPRWDGLEDRYGVTPLAQYSPSSAPSAPQDAQYHTKGAQVPYGSAHLSGGELFQWRSSPVTPVEHFGGTKFVIGPERDSRLGNTPGDETPDILKEIHSPIKLVKATSPNQKRVSPPHNTLQETRRANGSPVKSARKFILQSVPSFPPLTPYSEPKRNER